MPKQVTFTIRGTSPYSQSRFINGETHPKLERETADAADRRLWREHLHYDSSNEVYVPGMALKSAIQDCAQFLGQKIPEKRGATWTKHFRSGLLSFNNMPLLVPDAKGKLVPLTKDRVESASYYLNSNGQRGSGSRVWRTYPEVRNWAGTLTMIVTDDLITEKVFRIHLEAAGKFIGIGRFRPQNGGYFGLFEVVALAMTDYGPEESELIAPSDDDDLEEAA